MSIVKLCPYDKDEHCKYEIYYGEPVFSKCKNCEIKNSCRYETKKKKNTKSKEGVTMFEKEAEDYALVSLPDGYTKIDHQKKVDFQKGAEFGYNKANEWHYMKL